MKKNIFKKIAVTSLAVLVGVSTVIFNAGLKSNAASQSLGSPYNYVNITAKDGNNKDLTGATLELSDSNGNVLASWYSTNGSGARYKAHEFTAADAVDTKSIPAGQVGFYSTVPASDVQSTDISLRTHDENWNETGRQEIDMTKYDNTFGTATPLASEYSLSVHGSGNAHDYYKTSTNTENYYLVKIHLADYWPDYFADNGTHSYEAYDKYYDTKFGYETTYSEITLRSVLAIVSDQMVNFVRPDDNGDAYVYVNANTSHMDYATDFRFKEIGSFNNGGGGGAIANPFSSAYNRKVDVTKNENGTRYLSAKNVPAGTYKVTATKDNQVDTETFTVVESTDPQNIVLTFFGTGQTVAPTEAPTEAPTVAPTEAPTTAPTVAPTEATTEAPTTAPTVAPTQAPAVAATTAEVAADTDLVEVAANEEIVTEVVTSPSNNFAADPTTVADPEDPAYYVEVAGVQTGDRTNMMLLVFILLLSAIAVGLFAVKYLKNEEN